MGFFDNYRSSLTKALKKQAVDKFKDPAERPSKKEAPKKSGLASQLAAQRAKYSTPQYEEARQARLKRQSKDTAPTSVTPTTKPKAPPPFFSDEGTSRSRIRKPAEELPSSPKPIPPAPKAAASKPAAAKPKAAAPKPAAAKSRNSSSKAADVLGLSEDNAVMKLLRKNAEMEESVSKGAYAKGGKIDGCAQRGKTKLKRYV